jgi:hypothetical protein
MPFSGIACPEELRVLRQALRAYCQEAGIEPGTAAHEDAAWLVMTLFSSGVSTPEELSSALSNSLVAVQRYGLTPPSTDTGSHA